MKQKPTRKSHYSNGLRIYYLDWGGNSKKHMLLIHDLGDSSRTWDLISARFREEYRVFSVELRGHGHSDRPSDPKYRFEDFYGDISSLASSLNLDNAVVIGHGAGARLAAKLSIDNPGMVSDVVLYDFEESSISEPTKWISIEDTIEFLHSQRPRVEIDSINRQARNLTSGGLDGSRGYIHDTSAYDVYIGGSLWDGWSGITCSTLILRGRMSQDLTHAKAIELAELIPNSKLVELENGGHWLHQELPDEFNDVIRWFLDSTVSVNHL